MPRVPLDFRPRRRSPDWYREKRQPRKTTTTSSSELKLQYPPSFTAKGLTERASQGTRFLSLDTEINKGPLPDCPAWVSPAAALMTR